MIVNVPTADDFNAEALELLGLAWDLVAGLLSDLHEMEDFILDESDVTDEARERYWHAAKRKLTTALSLTQQGAEFGLKAKVAAVSPFLLLDEPAAGAKVGDIDFSALRTVDAQDLPKVHDAVMAPRLDDEFKRRFTDLRALRNRVIHTVTGSMPIAVHETLESILFVYARFFPNRKWPSAREDMLANSPAAVLGEHLLEQRSAVYREIALAAEVLSPSQVKTYFGINKRHRLYKCPDCLSRSDHNFDLYGHLSELIEDPSGTLTLFCPICDTTHPVERGECDPECGGTVFADGSCMRCYRDGG